MNTVAVATKAVALTVVAQCKAEGFHTRTIKTNEGYLVMFFN